MSVLTLLEQDLGFQPSCIEICPHRSHLFVLGSYYLEPETPSDVLAAQEKTDDAGQSNSVTGTEEGNVSSEAAAEIENEDGDDVKSEQNTGVQSDQTRSGRLVLFTYNPGSEDLSIVQLQTLIQPSAILDLHFRPNVDEGSMDSILGIVSSTGTFSVFKLSLGGDETKAALRLAAENPLPESSTSTVIHYFAWHPSNQSVIAISDSAGGVSVALLNDDHRIVSQTVIVTHNDQAWCAAIAPCPPPSLDDKSTASLAQLTVFSGGDDFSFNHASCLLAADGSVETAPEGPVRVRGHDAGVTAILPLGIPLSNSASHLVITGSFDEKLRIWIVHPRGMTGSFPTAKLLAEEDLDGGIWRLKLMRLSLEPFRAVILASCMFAGPRIVEVSGDYINGAVSVKELARFSGHTSVNYGSDFQLGDIDETEVLCMSTSFYDRKFCIWRASLV